MSKKLTIDYVKCQSLKAGFICLSDEYKNCETKMLFNRIDCDHDPFWMRWHNFKRALKCPKCSFKSRMDYKRYTIDDIKKMTKRLASGYECLSGVSEYSGNKDFLLFNNTNCNHKSFRAKWNTFQQGLRCPPCRIEESARRYRFSLERVKKDMAKIAPAYEILSTEYKNNKTLILINNTKCSHDPFWMRWSNFKNKHQRCPECWKERQVKDNPTKKDFKFWHNAVKKGSGGKILLLDLIYMLGKKTRGIVWCKVCFHEWETSIENIYHNGKGMRARNKDTHGCPMCYIAYASARMIGEKNPCWRGGWDRNGYCELWKDKEFLNYIKERDGFKCQHIDCKGTSSILCVHHIDHDRKNCDEKNLITLCLSCHGMTNGGDENRNYWINYYNQFMRKVLPGLFPRCN